MKIVIASATTRSLIGSGTRRKAIWPCASTHLIQPTCLLFSPLEPTLLFENDANVIVLNYSFIPANTGDFLVRTCTDLIQNISATTLCKRMLGWVDETNEEYNYFVVDMNFMIFTQGVF